MKLLQLAAFMTALLVVAGTAPSLAAATSATATLATVGRVATTATGSSDPTPDDVPLLFNDHHVNARPSILQQGRVLTAIVYKGTLLVPLRGMFEQMGATVSYDPASKTVIARKEDAVVQLTLGKNEAVINGESRPLDVAPMMYRGTLMVPVRVVSEALGAYVQWVPDQHVAVVRYAPATPAPTPAPTEAPTPVAVATPAPPPARTSNRVTGYLEGGIPFAHIYNEFATNSIDRQGNDGLPSSTGFPNSAVARGALMYKRLAVKVDWRQDVYDTNFNATAANGGHGTLFRTIDGGTAITNQFRARQSTVDARVEWKLFNPNVYFGAAYLWADNNYGYPRLKAAGAGLEKLPRFDKPFSWYASGFYYPNANGTWHDVFAGSPHFGQSFFQSYNIVKYDAGFNYNFRHTPIHFFGGYSGDQFNARNVNAPVNQSHNGPYVGLGVHF